MDGEWIRGQIAPGGVSMSDHSAGSRHETWTYTLTAPDGTEFYCNRSWAGYTSVHLQSNGSLYMAFSPAGAVSAVSRDLPAAGEDVMALMQEAGRHLYGQQFFGGN